MVSIMPRKWTISAAALLIFTASIAGQEATITPPESIVAENVAKIPVALAETAGRYASYRTAGFLDWSPTGREMLISTRFADTPQLHLVKAPGGARQQLTFF